MSLFCRQVNHSKEPLGKNAKRTQQLSLPTGPVRDLEKLNTKAKPSIQTWSGKDLEGNFTIWETGYFSIDRETLGSMTVVKWRTKLNFKICQRWRHCNGSKSQTQRYFHKYGLDNIFGSNYRMQGHFGPPVLHVSKSFQERSIRDLCDSMRCK